MVPRIEGGRRVGSGELGGHRLAQHDGPSLLELGDHGGVVVGHEVGVEGRAGCGLHACGVEDDLQADGDAVQGPRGRSLGNGLLSTGGRAQHFFAVDGDPRLQVLLGVDAGQQGLGQLHRGELAGGDLLCRLGQAQLIRLGHGSPPDSSGTEWSRFGPISPDIMSHFSYARPLE